MTPVAMQNAISDIRQFLRTRFPKIAYGIQPIGPDVPALFPEEAQILSPNAVIKRRLEFAAGRHAARVALRSLGQPKVALGKSDNGQPLWPNGTVGSITHTEDLAIAVATVATDQTGIGVDLELIQRFRPDLAEAVLTANELSCVQEQSDLAAIFSAKEATYKAIFTTLGKVIGFQDVELSVGDQGRCFSATAVTDFSPEFPVGEAFLNGRILSTNGMILSVALFGSK